MVNRSRIVTETISVRVVRHPTGTLAAFSDDLKGLLVPASSHEELDVRIPLSIREILEAQGKHVISVTMDNEREIADGFVEMQLNARAEVQAAAA